MVVIGGEEYLTVEEASERLGVKPATLYAYVSRGVLQSYRQGRGRHRLYHCPGAKHLEIKLPAKLSRGGGPVELAELRAENHQSVVPPSAHPDGGCYEWVKQGQPSIAEAEPLERAVRLAAVGGALAYVYCDGATLSTLNFNTFSQVAFDFRVTSKLLVPTTNLRSVLPSLVNH